MNEQEMFLRVGELAGRVGYPMPTVNWVEGVAGEDCVRLIENREGGSTLIVHDHVDEHASEQELDLMISQRLVEAQAGVFGARRGYKYLMNSLGAVVCLAAILIAGRLVDHGWLAVVIGVAVAFAVTPLLGVVISFAGNRRFSRRVDRTLADLVGRDQLVEWLGKIAAAMPDHVPLRVWLRWLWLGAPPLPSERLRALDA